MYRRGAILRRRVVVRPNRRDLVRAMILFWSGFLAGGLAVCLGVIFWGAARA